MPETSSHVSDSEIELIRACVDGSESHWAEFTGRYGRLIEWVAQRMYAKFEAVGFEVADLVGHIYEKLVEDGYRRLRLWRRQCKFSTYLVLVARRLCIDWLVLHTREKWVQHNGEVPESVAHEVTPAAREADKTLVEAIRSAIESLPPRQALIMRLRLDGKSLREIAKRMRIPEGTVFAENSRAIKNLRKLLKDLDKKT